MIKYKILQHFPCAMRSDVELSVFWISPYFNSVKTLTSHLANTMITTNFKDDSPQFLANCSYSPWGYKELDLTEVT